MSASTVVERRGADRHHHIGVATDRDDTELVDHGVSGFGGTIRLAQTQFIRLARPEEQTRLNGMTEPMADKNRTPEQKARDNIDATLEGAGWNVQSKIQGIIYLFCQPPPIPNNSLSSTARN